MFCAKVTFLLVILLLGCRCGYISGQTTCYSQAPPPRFTKQISDLTNETMAIIGPQYRTAVTEGTVTRTPELVDPRGQAFVEDRLRAVCPWSYVRNEDPERIPRVIFEAKCIHSSCHGCRINRSPLRRPRCSEVYYYTSVMRKTGCDDSGSYQYEKTTLKISAGCTCLRPAGSTLIPVQNGSEYSQGHRTNT